jgi:hypothetical protein
MYRLSYRNLGNREAMVVESLRERNSVVGVRWYEFAINNFNVHGPSAVHVRPQ